MSSLVAWEDGEVFLKSTTFEELLVPILRSTTTASDRESLTGALAIGGLWPDDHLDDSQRPRVLRAIMSRADSLIAAEPDAGSTRAHQLGQLRDELRRRYPYLAEEPDPPSSIRRIP
ncbi:MAG: hypothetical protein JWQ95_4966 [Sphaerisporangium sp.]|jgi:hypothetical protein|nr:hypothetical protein [Sphaerisporangium sp.]